MTEDKIIEKIKKEKPSEKMLTQRDLTKFKKEIDALLETRFSDFVDGFLEAWSDAQKDSEKCDCPECSGENKLDNPRRYMIQAGGNTWWVDNFKPGIAGCLDVIWTEELGGKTKFVKGTIASPDISIFDFENVDITPEIFDKIRRQTLEFAMQSAHEAQAKEKAMKAMQDEEPSTIDASSHVSYG